MKIFKITIVKFSIYTLLKRANFKPLLSIVLNVLILTSLSGTAISSPQNDGIIRMGGSTTLLPVISKIASDYMETYETWDKVDPSFPKKDIIIFISGGGSGFGMRSVINGTVHIGMASRNIKDKEKKLLGEHKAYMIGKDAVVFATNKKSPIAKAKITFDFASIKSLFSGSIKTFKDISASLPEEKIVLYVRDAGAGSAEMLQKLAMGNTPISPGALQLPSQGALLKKLETNKRGIGYISSGLAFGSEKIYSFTLENVVPNNENVIKGKYPFVRPLLLVVKGKPDKLTAKFIEHVLTDGQKVVANSNYVPLIDVE